MTSHTGRLYALAAALLSFFVLWAVIAAHPWTGSTAAGDPRLAALAQREHRLRADAALVQKVVDRRLAAYRASLATRRSLVAETRAAATSSSVAPVAQAAAPSVRVVTLPPLVITRTS